MREATGKLTKYWCDNYYCGIAQSMIEGSTTLEELQMFRSELLRMEEERLVDFNFSEMFGTDYEMTFSPLDHFIGTMRLLVAEIQTKLLRRQ